VASLCCSWNSIDADGIVGPGENEARIETIRGSEEAVRDTLLRGCWWHISGCAIRRAAFLNIGDFSNLFPYCADWEWLLRALSRRWSVLYIARSFINYRQVATSVASQSFAKNIDISEAFTILKQYSLHLHPGDIVNFHASRSVSLARRFVGSLLRFHWL